MVKSLLMLLFWSVASILPAADAATPLSVTPVAAGSGPTALPLASAAPAWQPAQGSMAVNFAALSGYGLGLIDWHSDAYSEEFQLTYSLNHADEALQQSEGYLPASYTYGASSSSWSLALTPLQRWRLFHLGRFGGLFLDAGPYASYAHYQYQSDVSKSNFIYEPTGYEVAYEYDSVAVGLKAGIDVEVYIVQGWSIQLGYLVSGAWLHFYEPEWQTTNAQYVYDYTGWTFNTGSAQAGLNYYFR
jgi:hypothetical protein